LLQRQIVGARRKEGIITIARRQARRAAQHCTVAVVADAVIATAEQKADVFNSRLQRQVSINGGEKTNCLS
jgi:hypothetical protein